MMSNRICLASRSPRRRALLDQIGIAYRMMLPDEEEPSRPHEAAADCVQRLAQAKARSGWQRQASDLALPTLGADTIVVADERILGKPAGKVEALAMLDALSGSWHEVFTGVAVVDETRERFVMTVTQVEMRPISPTQAARYWDTGEPADKAGAYAIQGIGGVFVRRIHGSFTGVVGLPLAETVDLLAEFGVFSSLLAPGPPP